MCEVNEVYWCNKQYTVYILLIRQIIQKCVPVKPNFAYLTHISAKTRKIVLLILCIQVKEELQRIS